MMQENLQLNIPDMDKMHDEFLDLLSKIQSCNNTEFLPLFKEMITHTNRNISMNIQTY